MLYNIIFYSKIQLKYGSMSLFYSALIFIFYYYRYFLDLLIWKKKLKQFIKFWKFYFKNLKFEMH